MVAEADVAHRLLLRAKLPPGQIDRRIRSAYVLLALT
jgi:hypothetical protein